MSDYEFDNFSDYDELNEKENDLYREIMAGENAEDELVTTADPDEIVDQVEDEDDKGALYESDEETEENKTDDVDDNESHWVDLKTVSNYNKEIIIVKPKNRRTSNIMSKYEMTEYTSIRGVQISQYNNCTVDTTGLDDPIKMARRELMMRRCPLVLRRYVGKLKNKKTGEIDHYYEDFDPAEMQFAVTYNDVL